MALNGLPRRTWGHIVRNALHDVGEVVGPYVKIVIPNFRAAHYFYVISMSFLLSVIVFPISSFRYIDILFLMSGACTQAGLNTIDLNELKLSQQILVYITCTLTTPIFIHGLLLFLRLYWFERHFDNIKETSKLNSKMRRSATLARSRTSADSTRVNTVTNQGIGMGVTPRARSSIDDEFQNSSGLGPHENSTSSSPIEMEKDLHYSEPSDDEDLGVGAEVPRQENRLEDEESGDPLHVGDSNLGAQKLPGSGIKFGNLPHPSKRTTEIEPSDMYKSIAMMARNRRESQADDDVLVIKLPGEIERDSLGPIFTSKGRGIGGRKWKLRRSHWLSLKKTLSGSSGGIRRPSGLFADAEEDNSDFVGDEGDENDYASVDSEAENDIAVTDSEAEAGAPRTSLAFDLGQGPRRSRARSKDEEDGAYGLDTGVLLSRMMSTNYLSWTPTIGRNSAFVRLTEEQKEELGGVEYRAIKLLTKILLAYYIGFHVIAFIMYVAFIKSREHYASKMREFGISPVWWGFFTAQLVFNDLGLTLTPNSMSTFSLNTFILVVSCFFIVVGNTGFPIMLRFIIWVLFKTAKPLLLYKESLGFLLDHPRRCFTLLFPSVPTWWLFFILVVLNATDLVLYIILDLDSDYFQAIPTGYRVLDGLFQAFSTRTAGFTVIDLAELHPAVQVSYMIMMYISVLPLAILIRRTNVYEEQSLGIYARGDEAHNEDTPSNFIGTHLRNQLSFDLWFIFLGLFIICIAEKSKLDQHNWRFSIFAILFEIVSAYGTVGLSLGFPGVNQSLSYKFTTISKLVIIAMMIRGRHRGLPYALDRAIMLPDADMERRDDIQQNHAMQRAATTDAVLRSTTNDQFGGNTLNNLRRVILRTATAYRRHSLFPAPTLLPEETHEMGHIHRRRSTLSFK